MADKTDSSRRPDGTSVTLEFPGANTINSNTQAIAINQVGAIMGNYQPTALSGGDTVGTDSSSPQFIGVFAGEDGGLSQLLSVSSAPRSIGLDVNQSVIQELPDCPRKVSTKIILKSFFRVP